VLLLWVDRSRKIAIPLCACIGRRVQNCTQSWLPAFHLIDWRSIKTNSSERYHDTRLFRKVFRFVLTQAEKVFLLAPTNRVLLSLAIRPGHQRLLGELYTLIPILENLQHCNSSLVSSGSEEETVTRCFLFNKGASRLGSLIYIVSSNCTLKHAFLLVNSIAIFPVS
jgi:hypothetical protein